MDGRGLDSYLSFELECSKGSVVPNVCLDGGSNQTKTKTAFTNTARVASEDGNDGAKKAPEAVAKIP